MTSLRRSKLAAERRNQKLLEETPAVGLSVSRRRVMAEAAVKAAAAVAYRNAGTIEFIVSGEEFYFLEMNTRLQVEHPVTESVLGIDLVREQIRLARGERIPDSGYPQPRGHAIEFRINAEDPLRNFMPTPRRVQRYAPPSGPGVRVDSGIRPHQEISPHFDQLHPGPSEPARTDPGVRGATLSLRVALRCRRGGSGHRRRRGP